MVQNPVAQRITSVSLMRLPFSMMNTLLSACEVMQGLHVQHLRMSVPPLKAAFAGAEQAFLLTGNAFNRLAAVVAAVSFPV